MYMVRHISYKLQGYELHQPWLLVVAMAQKFVYGKSLVVLMHTNISLQIILCGQQWY